MAIIAKKRRVTAAQDSTSLHFPNMETKKEEDSGQKLENNFSPSDLLIDPDDVPGSTHFTNNEKFSEKTNRIHSALKKPVKAKKAVKAEFEDDEVDEEMGDPDAIEMEDDPDGDFPAGDEDAEVDADVSLDDDGEGVPGDTQHLPNDVDPTKGYITTGGADDDDEFDAEEDEVNASFPEDDEEVELVPGASPQQSLLQVDEDWDPTEEAVTADAEEEGDEDDGSLDQPSDEMEEDEDEEIEARARATARSRASAGDEMPLVDVDGTDDEGDDVLFASHGMRLHAIKANRIVASMGKKLAVKAHQEDVYMSDEFQDVTYAEMSKHGLRAGLQKMGFALATVNVSKNEVLNKRVTAKAQAVTAAVRRQGHGRDSVMKQCLAIAAVGINRQGFQGVRNELRAAFVDELESAGMRGAKALVRQVFAAHAVDYSKSLLTLATKLAGMPEVARNAVAASLDMTDESEMEDDVPEFGDSAAPDFQAEYADSADEDFEEEMEDEMEEPQTLTAALSRPLMKTRATANTRAAKQQTQVSSKAQAVLAGTIGFDSLFK